MANPAWTASGDYFETCTCDYLCPCLSSNLTASPTKGDCVFAFAFRVDRGRFGDVSLDVSEGTAERQGRSLGLTGIEFRILAALMRNRGRLVTYAELAEAVWSQDGGPGSNSLEVHVSRIRQKLEAGGEPRLIHTVRGIGYRFNPE